MILHSISALIRCAIIICSTYDVTERYFRRSEQPTTCENSLRSVRDRSFRRLLFVVRVCAADDDGRLSKRRYLPFFHRVPENRSVPGDNCGRRAVTCIRLAYEKFRRVLAVVSNAYTLFGSQYTVH